ncbi:AAA family ATPase [Paraburkholderia unamae]|uniref:Response regulator receiver protein n=1 Tax=Paraburkholderia unamae TaxID=219649 RepID=A0ABX5K883_9BURK|nr:AAA family ATPase [Paraburkholderia unamae]PVX70675.1 response regulator receiver protein [Paraburkholderia unamae]
MIDILITSTDAERLAQIMRTIAGCGPYRTTRSVGTPFDLVERGDTLDAFDVLIVDARGLQEAQLPAVSELCRRCERLMCVLLIPEASPDELIAAMRAGFRDVVTGPQDGRAIGEALQRAIGQRAQGSTRASRIVSFMSCKGGVGTSFIAANVAHIVSQTQSRRVLLIDLNQLYADAAFLVTADTPPSTLPQLCAEVDRMDVAFFDASVMHVAENFDILAGAGDPIKAGEMRQDRLEWVLGVATPRYDCVILDLGQTINPLSMLALDRSDEIHIVLQASMPHLHAGRRLLEILQSLGYGPERMRLLLNRQTRHGELMREAADSVLGMKPLLVIPDDARAVAEAVNQGVPIAVAAPGSAVTRALRTLAASVAPPNASGETARGKGESVFARMLGRQTPAKLGLM